MNLFKLSILAFAASVAGWTQPVVTLSVNPTSPVAGQPATLTATVTPNAAGTVTFVDGITELGKGNVNANGTATLLTNFGTAGRRNLRAIYAPSGSLVRAVSAMTPVLVTVTPPTRFDRAIPLPVMPSAVLDINRDGILDIIGGIPDGRVFAPAIKVFLGTGGGSFTGPIASNLPNATGPVGDFDGDGKLDIVGTGGFYKGHGDGSFSTTLTASPNVFAGVAVEGDFNGIVDIAGGKTTPSPTSCNLPNAPVTSALNNGAGQFVEMYTAPAAIAFVGRLNQDDIVDFVSFSWVAAGRCGVGGIGECTLHKSGPGGYSTSSCADEFLVGSAKISDFNGDGFDDIVAQSGTSSTLLVLLNDGSGVFEKLPLADSQFDRPEDLTAYDWNADGKMDLVTSSLLAGTGFWVRLGNGNGTFGTKMIIPGASQSGIPIELTGDGKTDLILEECRFGACTPVLLIGADTSSAAAPTITSFSPNSGVLPAGQIVNMTATLQHPAGANSINAFEVALQGQQSCYFKVNVTSNTLEALGKSHAIGTENVLFGGACALFSQNATLSKTGNTVQIVIPIQFLANARVDFAAYARIVEIGGMTSVAMKVGEFSSAPTSAAATTVTSITPTSGTGNTQTFRIVVNSPASNFQNVSLLVAPTLNGANACLIEVGTYFTKLLNDAGNQYEDAETGSSATTLSNSQCAVDPGAVKVRPNGSVWTIDIPIAFKTAFAGARKTYVALNNSGNFVERGTFQVTAGPPPSAAVPAVISLTPTTGSGSTVQLAGVFEHGGGPTQHYRAYILILPTPNVANYTAQGSCLVEYNRISNGVRLINDAGNDWVGPEIGEIVRPGAADLTNSQCTVHTAATAVAMNGNRMSVTVNVTLKPAMNGVMGTFLQELDVTGKWTGMTQFGNWVLTPLPSKPGPSIFAIGPIAGTGASAPLRAVVNHSGGVNNLGLISMLVADSITSKVACQVVYQPGAGLNLINDDGTALAGPNLTPGTSGTLSNSRCTIDAAGSTASGIGNQFDLNVQATFHSAFAGTKNVYAIAFDNVGLLTHWVQGGIWTVPQ